MSWLLKLLGIDKSTTAPTPPAPTPTIPAPAPEPLPAGLPSDGSTQITLQQRSRPGGWVLAVLEQGKIPLFGNNPVNLKTFKGGTWYEAIFTVTQGTLTITDFGVSGPKGYSPEIKGIRKGRVLHAGDSMHLLFRFAKPLLMPKITKQVNYEVWTKELGQIVKLSGYTSAGN